MQKIDFEVTLPKLGESILSATIVQWFKQEGDFIQKDEPLLEVSTDKVNSEIPAPVSGIVKEIYAMPDQELNVGDRLALIAQEGAGEGPKAASRIEKPAAMQAQEAPQESRKSFFSPGLVRLAQENGISLSELEKVAGTGEGGRVTKKDLENYLRKKSKPCPAAKKVVLSSSADVERVEMSGMRKAIAENLVRSFYEAPHATIVNEVDVTKIFDTISREKEAFLKAHGAKLTITSFIARGIARALKEFPLINSSLEDDTIVVKRFVNLGIAVSVEQGILVPVIRNCQNLSLPELTKAVHELSNRARTNSLRPDDVREGTITMTNFGMSGVLMGIPIIRYPEVAIIGVGAAQKRVTVTDNDHFAIRMMMNISLTFDHRVLDGMYGCGFLGAFKKHLEEDIGIS